MPEEVGPPLYMALLAVLFVLFFLYYMLKCSLKSDWENPKTTKIPDHRKKEALERCEFFYRVYYIDPNGTKLTVMHLFPEDSPNDIERRRIIIHNLMECGCNVTKIQQLSRDEVELP